MTVTVNDKHIIGVEDKLAHLKCSFSPRCKLWIRLVHLFEHLCKKFGILFHLSQGLLLGTFLALQLLVNFLYLLVDLGNAFQTLFTLTLRPFLSFLNPSLRFFGYER